MKNANWISARTCVYNIGYHFVWSTKYRRPVLLDEVEQHLKKMLMKIANESDFKIGAVTIMADHCHLFIVAHPKMAPSTIVKLIK